MIKVSARNTLINKSHNGYMGVSLHSQNHSEENLEAIIDWVNEKSNFRTFHIGLSDTLHRYNYMHELNIDINTAHKKSFVSGSNWLEKHRSIFERLNIPFKITRWDDWIINYKDQISELVSMFSELYQTNIIMNKAINNDICKYINRKNSNKKLENNPIDYLIEELAVYSILLDNANYTCVYPGKQLECFKVIRNGLIDNITNGIRNSAFVRLNLHKDYRQSIAA